MSRNSSAKYYKKTKKVFKKQLLKGVNVFLRKEKIKATI